MGMSYEQYWEGSPFLAVVYRKTYRLKRQIENEQAWLQGLYFYDAFAVCLENAFGKKGRKKQQYVDRPFDIFPLTKMEKKRRELEAELKMQQAMKEMARRQRQIKKGE